MFNKKESGNSGVFDTLVGVDTELNGNIVSKGTVRIDGKVTGSITVKGNVFVGSNAIVKGNIDANEVTLSGTVEGDIIATGLLRLLSSAKLTGNIQVQSFVTDEGAVFQGKCSMINPEPEPPKTKSKS